MIEIILDCIQFKLFVMLLCHNEILLQYDTSIISCIVYLEFSHFDLHYLYTSTIIPTINTLGEYRKMEQILNYLSENKEWLFSGAGLLIFSAIGFIIKKIRSKKEEKYTAKTMSQLNTKQSSGTQIGIQNNYYRKDDTNDNTID